VDALLPSQLAPGAVELDEELPPPASAGAATVDVEVVAPDDREPALDVVPDDAALNDPELPLPALVASALPQATKPSAEAAHKTATGPPIVRMFTSVPREDTARTAHLRATPLRIARYCSELPQGHAE
jgi:hypothetical protein